MFPNFNYFREDDGNVDPVQSEYGHAVSVLGGSCISGRTLTYSVRLQLSSNFRRLCERSPFLLIPLHKNSYLLNLSKVDLPSGGG